MSRKRQQPVFDGYYVYGLIDPFSNQSYKLTGADYDSIRQLYATGEYTRASLSKKFGVSVSQIRLIIRYETGKYRR